MYEQTSTQLVNLAPQPKKASFTQAMAGLLFGLLPIALLGFLAGLIFKELAFQTDGYFHELTNSFSVISYLLPITIVFSLIAYGTKDWLFIIYPYIVWAFGTEVVSTDLFQYIAHSIPGITDPYRITYAVAASICFASVYLVMRPLWHIINASKQPSSEKQRVRFIYLACIVINILLLSAAGSLGESLHTTNQRDRSFIRIPTESHLASSIPKNINNTHREYAITFPKLSTKKDDTYQRRVEVRIKELSQWWERGTRKNCGENFSVTLYPNQVAHNEYRSTPGGIPYAEAVFTVNRSNPPNPGDTHQEFWYCWVVDYQKYTAIVTDEAKHGFIENYPMDSIIDTISTSPTYLPDCWKNNPYESKKSPTPFYCSIEDKQGLDRLTAKKVEA